MDKEAMLRGLDIKAGAVRACYITIAPGQEATYIMKSEQAKAFKEAGYAGTVPLLVQAEMYATNVSAQSAADTILTQEAQWAYLAGMIERVRRTAKVAVAAAANDADAEVIFHAAIQQLSVMMP